MSYTLPRWIHVARHPINVCKQYTIVSKCWYRIMTSIVHYWHKKRPVTSLHGNNMETQNPIDLYLTNQLPLLVHIQLSVILFWKEQWNRRPFAIYQYMFSTYPSTFVFNDNFLFSYSFCIVINRTWCRWHFYKKYKHRAILYRIY